MEGSSPEDCPFWVRVIVNQYIASLLCIDGEQWRVKVFFQSGLHYMTGGKSSARVKINRQLSNASKLRSETDLVLMDMDNRDGTRLLKERHVSELQELSFMREKFESDDMAAMCKEEYAKCVKVLDRLSLVLCLFGLYLVLHYLLAQPAQLWVP